MREQLLNVAKIANGTVESNGIHDDAVDGDGLQDAEFSADEEIFDVSAPKEDQSEDEEQPSLIVRQSVTPTPPGRTRISNRSASKRSSPPSSLAKTKSALADIRQRFTGKFCPI